MRGAFSMYLISMIYSHCRTVWLSVPRSYKWRQIMFTVTKNINIKSNCNCILIKNKVHFAIDIFFFQSALTFLEFNALRIFFKSALLFPSTLTQRFMTRINQEIKKKFFLLISILLNKTSLLTGKILQFLNKSLKQTTT